MVTEGISGKIEVEITSSEVGGVAGKPSGMSTAVARQAQQVPRLTQLMQRDMAQLPQLLRGIPIVGQLAPVMRQGMMQGLQYQKAGMGKLGLALGAVAAIATLTTGLLTQSKIMATYTRATFQVLGAMMDTMLTPLLPLFSWMLAQLIGIYEWTQNPKWGDLALRIIIGPEWMKVKKWFQDIEWPKIELPKSITLPIIDLKIKLPKIKPFEFPKMGIWEIVIPSQISILNLITETSIWKLIKFPVKRPTIGDFLLPVIIWDLIVGYKKDIEDFFNEISIWKLIKLTPMPISLWLIFVSIWDLVKGVTKSIGEWLKTTDIWKWVVGIAQSIGNWLLSISIWSLFEFSPMNLLPWFIRLPIQALFGSWYGFQQGGIVPQTGMYMLHEGETVTPTSRPFSISSNIYVTAPSDSTGFTLGRSLGDEFSDRIARGVRTVT